MKERAIWLDVKATLWAALIAPKELTMQKSARFLVLTASLLATFAIPSLHAERAGTNPHPQTQSAPTLLQLIMSTVLSYFVV